MEKIFVIVALIAITIFFVWENFKKQNKILPYKKIEFLLNVPERRFFEKIKKLIPENYEIFPQIVLSNIVKTNTSKMFWKYQNKINKKTIDFVVFQKPYLVPVLAIEYDGSTHKRKDRIARDNFVNNVLAGSGIGILHVEHSNNINYIEIKSALLDILSTAKSRENN